MAPRNFLNSILWGQFAAEAMDTQRMLRFPPDSESADIDNPFARLPLYQFSQLSFKSFSEEEIKNQAGRGSLPSVGLKRAADEDEDDGVNPGAQASVRSNMQVC